MKHCCENKSAELVHLKKRQAKTLYAVLGINTAMFFVEFISGWIAGSTALLGDSLDMLGDSSVYAMTLYTLHRSAKAQARTSLAKGVIMLAFGLLVIAEAVYKAWHGMIIPEAHIMGAVGLTALAANTTCFFLLYQHRADNLNMRSTWLCSRNDVIANSGVILAALLVVWTNSLWPDLLVGVIIAILFISSSWHVLKESRAGLNITAAENADRK